MSGPVKHWLWRRISPPVWKMLLSLAGGTVSYFLADAKATPNNHVFAACVGLFVGSVLFIATLLVDVYRAVTSLTAAQTKTAADTTTLVDTKFGEVGEATRLYDGLRDNLITTTDAKELVDALAAIQSQPPLVQALARTQFDQLARFVKALHERSQADYEGEDRDWLLTLASFPVTTIDAISIVTVEAGAVLLDGGPRWSDRAQRYFDAQIAALQHVGRTPTTIVRRIFVVTDAAVLSTEQFQHLRQAQEQVGIATRVLDLSTGVGREYGDSSEFVLFDESVCYVPSPAARTSHGERPVLVNTRLEIDPERVKRHTQRFQRLWTALAGSALPPTELDVRAPNRTPLRRSAGRPNPASRTAAS